MSTLEQQALQARYVDLASDVGFKIVFADPDRPELIIGLLNAIIPGKEVVAVEFLNSEITPEDIRGKRYAFDIRCKEKNGRTFVVEMQKKNYDYLSERLIVYAGDPLKRLLMAGQDYDEINPLYVICISDFLFRFEDETPEERCKLVRRASLRMDDTNKLLSDILNFVYLQLPVVKTLEAEQPFLEQWAYVAKHIQEMDSKPEVLKNPYFDHLFRAAERKYISEEKIRLYDYMVRDEIQIKYEKLFEIREQIEARDIAIAKELKFKGVDPAIIAQCTGLTPEMVASL